MNIYIYIYTYVFVQSPSVSDSLRKCRVNSTYTAEYFVRSSSNACFSAGEVKGSDCPPYSATISP